jgi:hypothetical protein
VAVQRTRGRAGELADLATDATTVGPPAEELPVPVAATVSKERSGYSDRMAKDHGSSVKDDKQYEGLRKKGMSKSRAAAIANSEGSSSRGGKKSRSGAASKSSSKQGGTTQQKKAAGRKGGKAAASKS